MDSDVVSLLLHAKNYFIATILLKASTFLILPILTKYLTTAEYGTISLFNSYLGIITILFPLYLYSSVGRYKYELCEDYGSFIFTSLLISLLTFVIFSISWKIFDFPFVKFGTKNIILIYSILFITPMKIVASIFYQKIVAEKNSRLFAKIQIIEGYIYIPISIVLVILLPKEKYYGPILGIIISSTFTLIFSLYHISKILIYKIDINHIKYIIIFSVPQLPYALGGIILEQFGRIVIGKSRSLADLGVYSLGIQIAVIYSFVSSAIRTAWIPDFYKLMEAQEYLKITKLLRKIFLIPLLPGFFLIIFSREIIHVFANVKFANSYTIVPYIIIGYVFFDLFYMYSPYLEYKKHTLILSLIVIFCGIVSIILNYLLVQYFGLLGAGYSFSISYLFMFIVAWAILNLFYNIRIIQFKDLSGHVIIFLIFISVYICIDTLIISYYVQLIIRSILFLLFFVSWLSQLKQLKIVQNRILV